MRSLLSVVPLCAALLIASAAVRANDEEPSELSPEELRALEEALSADAALREESEESAPSQSALDPLGAWHAASHSLASMNPSLSLILDAGLAWFSDERTLQRGSHDPTSTGFFLQQLELAAGASVDPFLRFDANLVFTQHGVELEEAYATTLALPYALQARAGQFLTRFGRQNPTHPHSWSFVDRPLVLGAFFGSEGSRGLGAELSWLAPLPWYVELVASATEASGACCARSFLGDEVLPVRTPLDVVYTAALKQFFPFGDDWSLSLGASAQLGPNATGPQNRTEIYGLDLYLRWRPTRDATRQSLSLTFEGLERRRQIPNGLLVDRGFFVEALWHFLLRYELGARVEMLGISPEDPLGDEPGLTTRTSVQLSFLPSHFSRIRLQGAYGTPPDEDALFASRFTAPVWSAFLAFEVLVGAHGSHDF